MSYRACRKKEAHEFERPTRRRSGRGAQRRGARRRGSARTRAAGGGAASAPPPEDALAAAALASAPPAEDALAAAALLRHARRAQDPGEAAQAGARIAAAEARALAAVDKRRPRPRRWLLPALLVPAAAAAALIVTRHTGEQIFSGPRRALAHRTGDPEASGDATGSAGEGRARRRGSLGARSTDVRLPPGLLRRSRRWRRGGTVSPRAIVTAVILGAPRARRLQSPAARRTVDGDDRACTPRGGPPPGRG